MADDYLAVLALAFAPSEGTFLARMYQILARKLTDKDREHTVRVWQAEAMAYQRAIILFQSAQDAGGESLARLRIQQIGDTIEQLQNRPVYEETPERRDRLDRLRRAAEENGQPGTER